MLYVADVICSVRTQWKITSRFIEANDRRGIGKPIVKTDFIELRNYLHVNHW